MTRYRTAPKTDGIYQLLKERISNGFYSKEGMLPHETVLAEELDISRKTLRAALSRLAMENLVERVRGQGTFIRSGKPRSRILVIVGNMEDITKCEDVMALPANCHFSNNSFFDLYEKAKAAALR